MKSRDAFLVRIARIQIDSVPDILARMRQISRRCSTSIICMNADLMAGRRHGEEAVRQALRAEQNGTMIARSLEMEVLLYLSGQRQTGHAVKFGLHEGEMRAWVALIPPSEKAWEMLHDLVSPLPDEMSIPVERIAVLQDLFGITDAEIETVGPDRIDELVIERTALLHVMK